MLHKKDDCSFRGKQKLHTFSALLLLYGTRPGNSSEGQFAGLQSKWWNCSFPSFLEAHCKERRKSTTRCDETKKHIYLVVFWFIHSSHDDCSYKSTRPGGSSQVQAKTRYQKLLNLSAQANVSPYELFPGQPFYYMERADTYNVETVSRRRGLQFVESSSTHFSPLTWKEHTGQMYKHLCYWCLITA